MVRSRDPAPASDRSPEQSQKRAGILNAKNVLPNVLFAVGTHLPAFIINVAEGARV